jgi:YD repeat-containing protein
VIDTHNGTGYPAGAWAGTAVKSLALKGKGGVPDTATAVFANITVISTDSGGVSFASLPGGMFATGSEPGTTLNFRSNETTAIAAVLDLNAAGVVDIKHYTSATGVHVLVDIQGYFDGQVSTSSFTTVESRIYDSRTPNTPIPANSTVEVQIGGVGGLPPASPNVAGVVMNITPLTSSGSGFLTLWPSDEPEPNLSSVNYTADSVSNVIVVRPSATTGKVKIKNTGTGSVHIIIDSQGWFSNANLLPPVTANGTESGSRGKASMIEHTLTDSSKLALNPTNGNAVLTGRLFHIRGVGQDMNVAWRYNSKYDHRPTLSMGSQETSLRADAGTGNMIYTAPDGGWYTFTLTGTTYTMAAELNASLTKIEAGEYWLRFNETGITNIYRDNGHSLVLERSNDTHILNPTDIYYEYDDSRRLLKTFDTQGRTVSYVYNDTRNLNQPSAITDDSLNRTVNIEYGGGEGRMSKITDATGAVTLFAYTNGKLTSVKDGRTNTTTLAYAADSWVSTITYGSGSTAAATTTVTHNTGPTLSYLTDGNGKQTTYTLDASKTRVIKNHRPEREHRRLHLRRARQPAHLHKRPRAEHHGGVQPEQ